MLSPVVRPGWAGVLAALLALAGCGQAPSTVTAPADAAWAYVGDAACASCHADLAASYARTGMGRAVSHFSPAAAPERFGPDGRSPQVCAPTDGYCYEAFVRGDTLYQRETHPDEPGYERVHAAHYVVGSGNATRSYFLEAGAGYLTEMPLTWYVDRAVWDLSPGYDRRNSRFDRPISLECLTCHDGRPVHETSQNFYADVPLGITCERCHGPASAHVAAFEAGDAADPQIVNPARLSTARQLDVCQQCHLTGESVFAPGEDPTTYRPGRPLSAHRSVFVTQASIDDPESFGIASHAQRMMRSACFEESVGTEREMTCTTCHDPHLPTSELRPDAFSVACRSCHGADAHTAVCSRPEAGTRAEAVAGDCTSCHMRKAGTSDIPHVQFTDHWIRRRPPPSRAGEATVAGYAGPTPFTLVNVVLEEDDLGRPGRPSRSAAEAELEVGIATFSFWETQHRLRAYLPEAVRRLRRGLAGGAGRTDGRVALGRALMELDSLDASERVLAEAVRRDSAHAYAALWLGVVRLEQGAAPAAVGPLRAAARLAPRLTEARLKLAEAQSESGDLDGAVTTLERALREDPLRHAGAWNDLGFNRLQLGRLPAALAALRRAVALDPRQLIARVNLGSALLTAGDVDAAAAQLSAALRIDPASPPALGNLALVRVRQGREGEARQLLRQLLALDPADARAAALLQQLGP